MTHPYDVHLWDSRQPRPTISRDPTGCLPDNLENTADCVNFLFIGKKGFLARRSQESHRGLGVQKHFGEVLTVVLVH